MTAGRATRTRLVLALAGTACLGADRTASADENDVVVLPSVTPGEAGEAPRRPGPADGRLLMRWSRETDRVVADAVQDLGLTIDVSGRPGEEGPAAGETGLVEIAGNEWVVSPRLWTDGGRLTIRILVVAPGSNVVLSRVETVDTTEVEVTLLRMMRDLVEAGRGEAPRNVEPVPGPDSEALVYRARSQGRAVLALSSAAFGAYLGYSLQRASGSDDPRLLYPLIALGTGVGLGGAVIVADEWDVGLGDAWYLSAGMWWPTTAGLLLADGYDARPSSDRPLYGLVGSAAGMSLATFALTFRGMSEGGAALTHSGGAVGLFLGGLGELALEGTTERTPSRGAGLGAGAGVVTAGLVATQVHVAPSRVLLVDLGAVLGGLTGAAAASPLVIEDDKDEGRVRAWLGATAAGTLLGAAVGYFVTQPAPKDTETADGGWVLPYAGVIGATPPAGRSSRAYGAGLRGAW